MLKGYFSNLVHSFSQGCSYTSCRFQSHLHTCICTFKMGDKQRCLQLYYYSAKFYTAEKSKNIPVYSRNGLNQALADSAYDSSRWTRCCCIINTRRMSSHSNKDYKVNPEFINRNPRNLETMALAQKTTGWTYQYPRKDYYNKVMFEVTNRNTTGYIEHSSGQAVVSASTEEWGIKQHLYSCTDVTAAKSVGRVLAQRCLEAGLTRVFCDGDPNSEPGRLKVFLEAMSEGNVELSEPDVIKPGIHPGIDYDNPKGNRYAERKRWKDDLQVLP